MTQMKAKSLHEAYEHKDGIRHNVYSTINACIQCQEQVKEYRGYFENASELVRDTRQGQGRRGMQTRSTRFS